MLWINKLINRVVGVGIDRLIIIALCSVLFFLLIPLLTNYSLSGCDTNGHYYLSEKMFDYITSFKLSGYDMNWFGGFPLFTFYNPFPYILVSVIHLLTFSYFPIVFSHNLLLLLLPQVFLLSVYFTANAFFENRRISFYSFIFAFLLLLSNTDLIVEGVGIISQYHVGLFTNAFAWPLLIFFLGFLERLRKEKRRIFFLLSVLFLSLLILTHILTTIFAFYLIFIYLLINIKDFDFFKKIVFIIGLSLFITAFWWYPFAVNIYYTSGFSVPDDFNILKSFYGDQFGIIFYTFSFLGIVFLLKDRRYFFPVTFLLSIIFLCSGALGEFINIPIHYYRFGAGTMIITVFMSAYALEFLIKKCFFKGKFYILVIFWWVFLFGLLSGLFFLYEQYNLIKYNDNRGEEVLSYLDDKKGRLLFDRNLFDVMKSKHYFSERLPLIGMENYSGLLVESSLFANENSVQYLFDYNVFYKGVMEYYEMKKNNYYIEGRTLNGVMDISSERLSEFISLGIRNLGMNNVRYILTTSEGRNPVIDFMESEYNDGLLEKEEVIGPYAIIEITRGVKPLLTKTDYRPFLFVNKEGLLPELGRVNRFNHDTEMLLNDRFIATPKVCFKSMDSSRPTSPFFLS
ncbi:hypothetical protein MNSC_11600 [Minisyncoccus archaeophilus]|uniref:hypothetical protein n=1 Tax=Minisyncoccus archaeiphilus TaxID=3238481 RepID=UPI00399C9FFC